MGGAPQIEIPKRTILLGWGQYRHAWSYLDEVSTVTR